MNRAFQYFVNYKQLAQAVFDELGPGFSETIYHKAFYHALFDTASVRDHEIQVLFKPEQPVYYLGKVVGMIEPDLTVRYIDKSASDIPRVDIVEIKVAKSETNLQRLVQQGFDQLMRYKKTYPQKASIRCILVIFDTSHVHCLEEAKVLPSEEVQVHLEAE